MAIDPGEIFWRFLQNYRSHSFATWHIAKGGLSNHEAMKTLATAADCSVPRHGRSYFYNAIHSGPRRSQVGLSQSIRLKQFVYVTMAPVQTNQ